MKILRHWRLLSRDENGVELEVETRHRLRLQVLEPALFRVALLKNGAARLDRTWAIAPAEDVPVEGRMRGDTAGFSCPAFELTEAADGLRLATDVLRVTIASPLCLTWEARIEDQWEVVAQDRPTGAYLLDVHDHRHAHFMNRHAEDRYYGLGEKSGPLERGGRRFEMRNLDALGYDAQRTDPLYKHIPFTLTQRAGLGTVGLFYDTMASCWFDLGNELDNYHAPYRGFRAEDGDLDYYVSWAPDLLDAVKQQHRLTGGTAFMPRWGLGYSGSTMSYTDAPDAQDRLDGFLSLLSEQRMPCDSFQMSSGYTSIDGKRYVFNWNTDKFPDMPGLARRFAEADVHLIANIKPALLDDHPRYAEAADKGLFIRDSEADRPELSTFWDGSGSHLDFTNPDTIAWWQENVTAQLLEKGIGSTWNDNNEYEVWDGAAQCAGFGSPIDVALIRPLHSQLMTRASRDAQQTHAPDKRPYLISRCACPGTQRYAQTWTGDNRTSWETLRWNIPMGLGLSLSGFYNIGHDVGGFAGPKPGPELFLRWVQNGIFHPRFTIHSWNDDGTANEPWMHPEVTDLVRDALDLRYRLMPYLYTLLYRAVTAGEPMLRPLFLDHPADEACYAERPDFLLGQDLLVASVVEEGAQSRTLYLPKNPTGWRDFHSGTWYAGGQELTLPVTLSSIPLFLRGGAVLPLAEGTNRTTTTRDRRRSLLISPTAAGTHESWLYEDDGFAADALRGNHCLLRFSLVCGEGTLSLNWQRSGAYAPPYDRVTLQCLGADPRDLRVQGQPHSFPASVEIGGTEQRT